MEFTKEQILELMCKHAKRENGLHDLFEIINGMDILLRYGIYY